MVFEAIKAFVILIIAVPFLYILFDVTLDLVKRTQKFLTRQAKPVVVRIKGRRPGGNY